VVTVGPGVAGLVAPPRLHPPGRLVDTPF
jgi:hypothetical protein